jgi:sulfur carrier protein
MKKGGVLPLPYFLKRRIPMIEVRLFATLRQGRQKIYQMENASVRNVQDIMDLLEIPRSEVNILLINGFHQKPETEVKEGDVVSLFPAVGGG